MFVLAAAIAGTGAGGADAATWSGSFRLPAAAEPVAISVGESGSRLTVALGPGHAGRTIVHRTGGGGGLSFSLPGRPAPLVFTGRRTGTALAGTVRQGSLRGTFTLRVGRAQVLPALGDARDKDRALGVAVRVSRGVGPGSVKTEPFVACVRLDEGLGRQVPERPTPPEPTSASYDEASAHAMQAAATRCYNVLHGHLQNHRGVRWRP